jgi:hypothetical protein
LPLPEKAATAASRLSEKNLSHWVDQMAVMADAGETSFSSLIHPSQHFLISITHHIAKQHQVTKDSVIAKMEYRVKI